MIASIVPSIAAAWDQSWPPFALVVGLLLVGVVADEDGLFAAAGGFIATLPGGGELLFAALLALVAAVTVVLNLDTAVWFLTPVLVHAARARRLDERPFLLGSVMMANSASLLLPGSNLTNLLVVAEKRTPGHVFAARMAPGWAAAVVVTGLVVGLVHRRGLRDGAPRPPSPPRPRIGIGAAASAAAAVLVLVLSDPAPYVLALGAAAAALRRLSPARIGEAVDLRVVAGLLAGSVALGTLARQWGGPARVLDATGRVATAAIGALAAICVNNLPATVLLASQPPPHARALLLGLDLGPNLAVTGSLSAVLWLQAARLVGARASVAGYSRIGILVAPLAIVAALAVERI